VVSAPSSRKVLCLLGLTLLPAADARAQEASREPIQLVVIAVIDQWRGDSIVRYEPLFGPDGFRRLRDGGVWYQNAHHDHANTVTGPGHATIGTGASPAAHGIIGNDWIDRSTGKRIGCVADEGNPIVGGEAPTRSSSSTTGSSPIQLLSSTFSDEWILATSGRARAFGVSGKDRAAILVVGKTGKAFWYQSSSGRMVSSRYYYPELPAWAAKFNEGAPAEKYAGRRWERATRDDDGVPSAADDRSFETSGTLGRTFPHQLAGRRPGPGRGGPGQGPGGASSGQGVASREGDGTRVGADGARAGGADAARAGGDGGDGAADDDDDAGRTDSASKQAGDGTGTTDPDDADRAGSGSARGEARGGGFGRGGFGRGGAGGFGRGGFGQTRVSEQLMTTPFGDALLLDFAFELIKAEQLGKRGALDVISISLSANDFVGHAYGPDSVESKELAYSLDREIARLLRFLDESVGEGRYALVLTSDHGVAYPPESVSAVGYGARRYSHTEMARQVRKRISLDHRYLEWDAGFGAGGFYFDPDCLARGGVAPDLLERTAAEVLRGTRGIQAAYTRGEILGGKLPDTDLVRSIRATYHAERSPDVYVVAEPYWIEGTGTASHGTPHAYDSHVPLVFYGAGLEPRRVLRPVSIRSLAPTITAILGCTPPSACQAEPLPEVLEGIGKKPGRG